MNQPFTYTTTNLCLSFAETFTFSAKEKDAETGYSYFGSRYYTSDLSIWLSVDPMSDKYPSLSPYTYCANNPIKLVDPNGEEFGDYYDFYGNYLGTDGNKDGIVYLVQGSSTSYIKNHKVVNKEDPNIHISQTTTYRDLATAVALFHSNGNNGGKKEVGGAYDLDGNWKEGESFDDHVKLPISVGKTSIHLHTWGKSDEIGTKKCRSPENPSDKDWDSFAGFSQNIIVGKTIGEYDCSSACFINRKPVICFYGNKKTAESNCTIGIEAAKKIINKGSTLEYIIKPF
jgi:RHS repeat-associated protein